MSPAATWQLAVGGGDTEVGDWERGSCELPSESVKPILGLVAGATLNLASRPGHLGQSTAGTFVPLASLRTEVREKPPKSPDSITLRAGGPARICPPKRPMALAVPPAQPRGAVSLAPGAVTVKSPRRDSDTMRGNTLYL